MNSRIDTAKTKNTWVSLAVVLGTAPVLALGLAGCSTAGSEDGASVEDVNELGEDDETTGDDATPYDGPYDRNFFDDIDEVHAGEVVTVTALVNQVVSPEAFTIAGGDETTVDELLVLHDGSATEVEPELDVSVTGTAETSFVLVDVEESMGVDLDDDLFADWEEMPYIDATSVDSSVNLED